MSVPIQATRTQDPKLLYRSISAGLDERTHADHRQPRLGGERSRVDRLVGAVVAGRSDDLHALVGQRCAPRAARRPGVGSSARPAARRPSARCRAGPRQCGQPGQRVDHGAVVSEARAVHHPHGQHLRLRRGLPDQPGDERPVPPVRARRGLVRERGSPSGRGDAQPSMPSASCRNGRARSGTAATRAAARRCPAARSPGAARPRSQGAGGASSPSGAGHPAHPVPALLPADDRTSPGEHGARRGRRSANSAGASWPADRAACNGGLDEPAGPHLASTGTLIMGQERRAAGPSAGSPSGWPSLASSRISLSRPMSPGRNSEARTSTWSFR